MNKKRSVILGILGLLMYSNPVYSQEDITQATLLEDIPQYPSEDFLDNDSFSNNLNYTDDTQFYSQRVNVKDLRDVQPTDWAFEALRSLVENYGCIVGYPDRTFRGNRAISRYEFAAGLNACMEQMERLISESNTVIQADIEALSKLAKEFETELAALGARVDNLEGRIAFLEDNQFSTTVIMGGETIFALSAAGGGDPPGTGNAEPTLNYLSRIQLASSFFGTDRLRMEISSGNFDGFGFASPDVLNTNTALLSFQESTRSDVYLSMLEYRFALGNRLVFTVRPVGFSLSSVLTANAPYFDAGRGAISRFGQLNPIFRLGNTDAGIGMDWLITNRLRLQLAYGSNNSSNPDDGFFLGEGAHVTGLQLLSSPTDTMLTGITAIYGYSPDGRLNTFTGSAVADASGFINQPANIYAFGGSWQWRIAPWLNFSTWGGITGTYASQTDAFAVNTNYMFSLGFPDLFKEGNLLAVMFGEPPKITNMGNFNASSGLQDENATSFHIEVFYRHLVNDNISITPGFFVVTNPGNIEQNNTIWVGSIRTTFRF